MNLNDYGVHIVLKTKTVTFAAQINSFDVLPNVKIEELEILTLKKWHAFKINYQKHPFGLRPNNVSAHYRNHTLKGLEIRILPGWSLKYFLTRYFTPLLTANKQKSDMEPFDFN